MEPIILKKKELLEISNLNPNNDEFNQMIVELSKQKPPNQKLKRCRTAEQKKIFTFLQEVFYQNFTNNRQFNVQQLQFFDSIDFIEFILSRENILNKWFQFLQNNAAYYIFIDKLMQLEEKLKHINKIHLIYQETQNIISQIKFRNQAEQVGITKKMKIQNY